MMELEKGEVKIQKICDQLRKETLEPARQEAEEILEQAKKEAGQIVKKAKEEAKGMTEEAKKEIARERNVFESSLNQSVKQSLDALKEGIENQLFNAGMAEVVEKEMKNPQLIADMLQALVKGIEEQGMEAKIPEGVDPKQVASLLVDRVLKKFKGEALQVGHFGGGVQLKLTDRQMTLDLSDEALKELLARFVRRDYRELIFVS
ncbi:MAG: V-type ATP synthase subunit E [Chlamydiia bacterium]|nr:V-type ATP synthase subunit E [Chlamydiia bacterium]